MICKFFPKMTDESKMIRKIVFIDEQGFREEFDEYDKFADTLVIYTDEGMPIATGRVFEMADKTFKLGRIAVLKEYRKCGLGRKIIKEMENHALNKGAKAFYISAQLRAKPFYEKCGYSAIGETYFEEHVEHIAMIKNVLQ